MNNNMLTITISVTNVVVTYRMIVRVVMSRATLVLGLSLDLSTCLLQPTTYLGPFVAFTMTARQTKLTFIQDSKVFFCVLILRKIPTQKQHN